MIKLKEITEDLFKIDLKIKPYEKMIINSVINFMKKKFGFDAKIIVKKKANNNLLGDISLNDNSLNKHIFYLYFNPNQSFDNMIKSLIHELIHIKQVVKGELKPSTDYKELIWKNKPYISVKDYNNSQKDFNRYKELPWEKEAFDNMNKLHRPFLSSDEWKSLKGKDDNIDYIINNI